MLKQGSRKPHLSKSGTGAAPQPARPSTRSQNVFQDLGTAAAYDRCNTQPERQTLIFAPCTLVRIRFSKYKLGKLETSVFGVPKARRYHKSQRHKLCIPKNGTEQDRTKDKKPFVTPDGISREDCANFAIGIGFCG